MSVSTPGIVWWGSGDRKSKDKFFFRKFRNFEIAPLRGPLPPWTPNHAQTRVLWMVVSVPNGIGLAADGDISF